MVHHQRNQNNLPVINPKDIEICDLSNKEFRISVLKKFNELEENKEKQFNEIRKTVHVQYEKFNKKRRIIKKGVK